MQVRLLLRAVQRLSTVLEPSRICPEIGVPDLRKIILGNYQIAYIYYSSEATAEILTMFYSSP